MCKRMVVLHPLVYAVVPSNLTALTLPIPLYSSILPLSLFSLFLDTLIYSVHCCFNRPLCPGVGIITELASRLIGLEPAITSVLLEYTHKHTGTLKH